MLRKMGFAFLVGLIATLTSCNKCSKEAPSQPTQNTAEVSPAPTGPAQPQDQSAVSPQETPPPNATGTPGAPQNTALPQIQIVEITAGTGAAAEAGKKMTVHYTGTLTNGTKFDSSKDRDLPFVFNLGAGQVIPGWEQGIAGMKEGGKRKLTIPPHLAYGERGVPGVIPPNSVLVFEIELIKVE